MIESYQQFLIEIVEASFCNNYTLSEERKKKQDGYIFYQLTLMEK